jgi:hypothetical protein
MKTSRRAFLKLFIGTVAVATLPIPKFLLPKEQPIFFGVDWAKGCEPVMFNDVGGVLTVEMIEEAAKRSAMNMGQPDMMYMSKKDYKTLGKYFGYKVVYKDDEIFHYAN